MNLKKSINLLQKKPEAKFDPYPHFIIYDALPDDIYQELYETKLTPEQIINGRQTTENQRVDIPTRKALDIATPLWREFILENSSGPFVANLLSIFGYRMLAWSSLCGIRGTGNYDISTECQPGLNTPLTRTQSVRGPHLDNPIELYGGMFYMPDPNDLSFGGELEIYRLIESPRFYGKLEIDSSCCELMDVVPYKANTLVMFLNGPKSVHGVSPRTPTTTYRQLVNLIGEVQKPLFKVGHGRY